VVDVVGVAGGGAVHRGLDQPVVAVVDEGVLATLHEVAGGVILVALGFGLEQPVVAAVDLVAVPLAVAEPRRAIGVVVVLEAQGAIAAGGRGEAISGVVAEGLMPGRLEQVVDSGHLGVTLFLTHMLFHSPEEYERLNALIYSHCST